MSLISYVIDFITPASVKKRREAKSLEYDVYSILESIKFILGITAGTARHTNKLAYAVWNENHGKVHSSGMFTEVAPGVILITRTLSTTSMQYVLDDRQLQETLQQYVAGLDGHVFQLSMCRGMHTLDGVIGEGGSDTVGYAINVNKFNAFIKRTPNKGLRISALRAHLGKLLDRARKMDYKLPFMLEVYESTHDMYGDMTVSCEVVGTLPYCDWKSSARIITQHFKDAHTDHILLRHTRTQTETKNLWFFTFKHQPTITFTDTSVVL